MKVRTFIGFAILALGLSSCSVHPLSATGDHARVQLQNGRSFSGEIIQVADSSIQLIPEEAMHQSWNVSLDSRSDPRPELTLYDIAFSKIQEITIDGYVNHSWMGSVIAGVAGAALLGIAAKDPLIALLSAIVPLLDALIFTVSEPEPPTFEFPLHKEDRDALQLYARWPKGSDPVTVQESLRRMGDPKVERIK